MTSATLRLSCVSAAIAFALSATPAASMAGGKPFLRFKFDTVFTTSLDGPTQAKQGGPGRIHVESWAWGATDSRGASDKWFIADSFSFGVEREMKESGEKGGTEDINIGVGELQEANISKSSDASKSTPKLIEAPAKGKVFKSAGPRQRGGLSIKVPAGTCKAGARYPAAEFGTDKGVYQLTGVVVTGCGGGGSAAMETLSLNYDKITWKYWP